MGTLKQVLPWPGHANRGGTIIASAYDAITPFCMCMHVVLADNADAITKALGDRPFARIVGDSDAEMMESVRAGVHAILVEVPVFDAVLMQPGDHPGVARATVEAMLAAHQSDPTRAVMPEHDNKGGHPVLVPVSIAARLLEWRRPGGLRQFWIDHPQLRTRLKVNDPLCTLDLDTPEDYDAARATLLPT